MDMKEKIFQELKEVNGRLLEIASLLRVMEKSITGVNRKVGSILEHRGKVKQV